MYRVLSGRVVVASRFTLALLVGTVACSDSTAPGPVPGAYRATTFVMTPDGSPSLDVLGLGGSFSVTIAANGAVTGALVVPAAVTGGSAGAIDYNGTLIRDGDHVRFDSAPGTFFSEMAWTVGLNTLSGRDQRLEGARFTIFLRRQ